MKSPLIYVLVLLCVSIKIHSQKKVEVVNLQVKLSFNETKDYFYAFEKGDILVFNLKMLKGKHIKKVEITELPTNIKLTQFKTRNLVNKEIKVLKKAVYRFRFYSSSLTNRVADVHLYRIPINDKISFNTNWKWRTLRDTTYVNYKEDSLIGYEKTFYKENVRELKSKKIKEIVLIDKSQKIHSYYNSNKSRDYLQVNLPLLENSEYKEEKLLGWSYWIGVGQESKIAYEKNIKNVTNLVEKGSNLLYQTPLAGLIVGSISNLIIPNTGEDVAYYFMNDYQNVLSFLNNQQFYLFDQGKGRAAYGTNDRLKSGTFYIGLDNDNLTRGVEVNVKVVAVKEIKEYHHVVHDREKMTPKYTTLNKVRIDVNEQKIRIPVE